MAKDDRDIIQAVRMPLTSAEVLDGNETFASGDEDALAAAMTDEQLQRLQEKGAIVGTWKSTKVAEKAEKADAAKAKPTTDAQSK